MREEVTELAGLRTVVVGDPDAARVVVVLLHGFAMTAADLSPFAHSLGVPALFVFPEGPLEGSLTPGVPCGRAWWRIDPEVRAAALARGPRDFAVQHPPDLPAARARLGEVLDAVPAIAPPALPLVLGGFSQGGMLACDTQLRAPRALAGLALLSASRIAFDEQTAYLAGDAVRGLPVLVSHGTSDADLSFDAGVALRDAMTAAGADVTWVPFEDGHGIPLVVWRRLRKMLLAVAPERERVGT